jgi:hypothetical protein
MIFVDIKEVTLDHGVAKESEWVFLSSSKRSLRQFVSHDSNTVFKDTQTRLPQPVDSYAH